MGDGKLRIVTHLDYTQANARLFLEVLNNYK